MSFGGPANTDQGGLEQLDGKIITGVNGRGSGPSSAEAGSLEDDEGIQPILTKSMFTAHLKASKRRIGSEADLQKLVVIQPEETRQACSDSSYEALPDATVDLNLPVSLSGRHWKGEYDQYQRKSNREMRRLIQHGQTIKSYAQKKDSEATILQEKLNKELAKTSSMEAKVSKLAIELAHAPVRPAPGNGEPTRLVNDLAKQTATAIRSKQKVERYRAALETHDAVMSPLGDNDECAQVNLVGSPRPLVQEAGSCELISLRSELHNSQSLMKAAEDRANKLRDENLAFKQKLARIKVEMQKYEQRRHTWEDRLARKQEKLLLAKERVEAKFEQLRSEHEQLQRAHQAYIDENRQNEGSLIKQDSGSLATIEAKQKTLGSDENPSNDALVTECLKERHAPLAPERRARIGQEGLKKSLQRPTSPLIRSPKRDRASGSLDDAASKKLKDTIHQAPNESSLESRACEPKGNLTDKNLSTNKTLGNSDYSVLRRSTHAALQEISQNGLMERQLDAHGISLRDNTSIESSMPTPTLHKPCPSSAVRRMHAHRSTLVSPRPSFLSMASSVRKPESQRSRPKSSVLGTDSGASILSAGTRASTLGSRKALPPDRADAARSRLEAKKGVKKVTAAGG